MKQKSYLGLAQHDVELPITALESDLLGALKRGQDLHLVFNSPYCDVGAWEGVLGGHCGKDHHHEGLKGNHDGTEVPEISSEQKLEGQHTVCTK